MAQFGYAAPMAMMELSSIEVARSKGVARSMSAVVVGGVLVKRAWLAMDARRGEGYETRLR